MSDVLGEMKAKLIEAFDGALKKSHTHYIEGGAKPAYISAAADIARAVVEIERQQQGAAAGNDFHETALTLAETLEQVMARLTRVEQDLGLSAAEETPQDAGPTEAALPKPGTRFPAL